MAQGEARHPSIGSHLQIVRSVPDHQGFFCIHAEFVHQLEQHGRMRLGKGFVGAAAGMEIIPHSGSIESGFEPPPAFSRGNRKQATRIAQGGYRIFRTLEKEYPFV